jgi:hypothetical protein
MYNDLWKFTIDPACTTSCALSLPVAAFTAPNHVCPGTCTDFTNTSMNSTSYQWIFQGAVPATSTDADPTNICYSTPGSYDVTLIATNAAGNDTLQLNNYMVVYPTPPPQGITQSGDTLFANAGAQSYQWYQDGNIKPGATQYFYVAQSSGSFNVVATDANGCEVEAVIFDVLADINQLEVGNLQLAIFPNPAKDLITIHSESFIINSVIVYNSLGEMLITILPDKDLAGKEMNIDLSSVSPGIYLAEIFVGEQTRRITFIRE